MGSIDIPPFLREKQKQKVIGKGKEPDSMDLPDFLKKNESQGGEDLLTGTEDISIQQSDLVTETPVKSLMGGDYLRSTEGDFINQQAVKGTEISLSNPELFKPKDKISLRNDFYNEQKRRFEQNSKPEIARNREHLETVLSDIATGDVKANQLQDLSQKSYGKEVIGNAINVYGDAATNDTDSGTVWDNLATNINKQNRKFGVELKEKAVSQIDQTINDILSNYKSTNVSVSGGTGGGAVSVNTQDLPIININDPSEYGRLFSLLQNTQSLTDASGAVADGKKDELLTALNNKLFYLKSKEPISEQINNLSPKIQSAIARINMGRERGENVDIETFATQDQINANHFKAGLNYIRDANPGKYKNIIRAIENKEQIADGDFEGLAEIGEQIVNFQVYRGAAVDPSLIGKETNIDYQGTSWQSKKAEAALAIGEYLKGKRITAKEYSAKEIKDAANKVGVTNPEIVNELVFEEGLPFYDAIPKSGTLEAFVRGLETPIAAIKNTVDVIEGDATTSYLRSQQLDVGFGQKVKNVKGQATAELPSERGNVWYDAIEGFGQFIPQVVLAKGIGGAIAGEINLVSRTGLTAAQTANVTNYAGTFISTYLQEYGQAYQDALQKTGDPGTAKAMGAINGMSAAAFELLLPDVKIADNASKLMRGKYAKDIVDFIKKGGDLTELAKKGRPIIERFVGETFDIARQEVAEEVGTNFVDYLTETIFSPRTAVDRDLGNELLETAKATGISMLIPSVLGAGGAAMSSDFTVNGFNSAAINFKESQAALNRALIDDNISQDQYNKAISLLKTHRNSIDASPETDALGKELTTKERIDYAYQETQIKINEEKAAKAKGVQKEVLENKIKQAEDIQRAILIPAETESITQPKIKSDGKDNQISESNLEESNLQANIQSANEGIGEGKGGNITDQEKMTNQGAAETKVTGAAPIVESAVIEINGKTYEGKNHAEAILKAKDDGQDISQVDRQAEGKFKLSDGTIIDRAEAKSRFGQDRSELLIEQDEAADQANEEYKKVSEPPVSSVDEKIADIESPLPKEKASKEEEIVNGKRRRSLSFLTPAPTEPIRIDDNGNLYRQINYRNGEYGLVKINSDYSSGGSVKGSSVNTRVVKDAELKIIHDKVNAKYDTELAELEKSKPVSSVEGGEVKYQGSKKDLIKELQGRKEDKAIHANIYQSNGYVVDIFDNNGSIENKKFKTHEEAKKFLNDWSEKNGEVNKDKYDYGTIQDIANLPYRMEIFGTLPKEFSQSLPKGEAAKQPIEEKKEDKAKASEVSQPAEKTISQKGKELADKIRQLKSKRDTLQSNILGIPIAIYDGAVEIIATAVEKGNAIADAIEQAINYIKGKWNDSFGKFDGNKIRQRLREFILGVVAAGTPLAASDATTNFTTSKPATQSEISIDAQPTINIQDTRTKDVVSGETITDRNNLSANDVESILVKNIVRQANIHGVDPYTAVALAIQETGLGDVNAEESDGNPFHILMTEENVDEVDFNPLAAGMRIFKEKIAYAKRLGKKTEAEQIQAWNGYGKVGKNTEGRQNKMYGIDVSKQDIDMSKNPVFGKRIIDIRENIVKKNPELVKLIEGETKTSTFESGLTKETISQAGKRIADSLRKLKSPQDTLQANIFGIPIAIYDGALEVIATAIEAGAQLADAIQRGIKYIRDNGGNDLDENGFTDHINDVTQGVKPRVKVQVGEPEGTRMDDKAILNRIMLGDNTSNEVKDLLTASGLKYKVRSQAEARKVGNAIIDSFGIDDAVLLAEAGKFHGDVNSMIFALSLDRMYDIEHSATTPEAKQQAAEQYGDISMRYQDAAESGGRFISAINDFYKKSPAGLVIKTEKEFQRRQDEYFEGREKPTKEAWQEFINTVEGKELLEEEMAKRSPKKKKIFTADTEAKIKNFFSKLKINTKNQTGSYLIPPQIYNAAIDVIENAVLAGVSIGKAIEQAVEYIGDNYKEAWKVKEFKKDIRDGFKKQNVQRVLSSEDREKILNKWSKKLIGLNQEQKNTLLNKAFLELIDNGALEYDQFKQLYAEALGLPQMTPELAAQLKELATKINEPSKIKDEILKTKSPELISKYRDAVKDAEIAATKLNDLIGKQKWWLNTFLTVMRLNTLGAVSLVGNIAYNVAALPVRFAVNLTATGIDYLLAGAQLTSDKVFGTSLYTTPPTHNVFNVQGGFLRGLWLGTKTSIKQFFTGLSNRDYFQKEIKQNIKPLTSAKKFIRGMTGKQKLTLNEKLNSFIEAFPTMGMSAEVIARALNIGDKGFRFAAEFAKAEQLAQQKGLKGIDKEIFILFPDEESENKIREAGEKIVFQQKNVVTKAMDSAGNAISSAVKKQGGEAKLLHGIAKTLGYASQPFLNTPLNVFNEFIHYAFPPLPLYRAGKAMVQGNSEKAVYHLSQAVVGLSIGYAATQLVAQGLITGSGDDDEEKERKGIQTFQRQGQLNLSGLKRLLAGSYDGPDDEDTWVDLKYYGFIGMLLLSKASQYKGKTKEEIDGETLLQDVVGQFVPAVKTGLTEGVFSGTSSLLNAISMGGRYTDNWMLGMGNVFVNAFEPNWLRSLSTANNDYIRDTRDMSLSQEAKNQLKNRFFSGNELPSKIDIWGEKIESVPAGSNRYLYNIMGLNKKNILDNDQFGYALYDYYNQTKNYNIFPPVLKREVNNQPLTSEQYEQFSILVGSHRRQLINPLIQSGKFEKLKGEGVEAVTKKLDKIYDEARNLGVNEFENVHPEFKIKKKK